MTPSTNFKSIHEAIDFIQLRRQKATRAHRLRIRLLVFSSSLRFAMVIAPALTLVARAEVNSCTFLSCPAGMRALTRADNERPFFGCPSKELAEYTNLVAGLITATAELTGHVPETSAATGEPTFAQGDETNATSRLLAQGRQNAGVSSFDAAKALCTQAIGDWPVTIVDSPAGSSMSQVKRVGSKITIWLPRSQLRDSQGDPSTAKR